MMSTTDNGRVFRSPFTANQWQEFEHQTLIYKYMISGVPVPPELIFPVKRGLEARLLPYQQPPIGWGCFQVGFGRKPDPEPGRCRRTDGKKWRCSKEAYPDSKYCEKHMHRGRSRSRKPVELAINNNSTTTPTPTTTTANPTTHSSGHRNIASASNSTLEPTELLNNPNAFIYSQDPDKDYRYYHGMRESMNERDFFTDSSGSLRSMQESYQRMSNTNTSINSYRGYHHQLQPPQVNINYSTLGTDYASKQQQHCYILGADFKSSPGGTKSMKLEKESDHSQRPLHHFFSEWAPKNTSTDCWLDLSSSSRSNTGT